MPASSLTQFVFNPASGRSRELRHEAIGFERRDTRLARQARPELGAHLVSPRLGFTHHGIYVGGGRVVHYGSLVYDVLRKPVEEVSIERFAHGRAVWVRTHARSNFSADEVCRRARSRLGEDEYRLFSNNCEHFCEWCLHDCARSYQVERVLAWIRFPAARPRPPTSQETS